MNDILLTTSPSSIVFNNKFFQKIFLGCLLIGLSIFTVLGNLLVFYAIRTEKRLRTVSNLFILSLAFADLIVGLFVMPLSAANIIIGQWSFSTILCKIWLSVDYVASTASIFNLVLLSIDRYWAVVYPLHYIQNRTRKRANYLITIIWLVSLLWAPAIIFWSYFIPEHSDVLKPSECDTSFRSNKLFKTISALINFYFPLLTMIIISCRIMIAIRSRSTMEFGRRISSATQKQMRRERTFTSSSFIRHENPTNERKLLSSSDDTDVQSMSIILDPLDSVKRKTTILSDQYDETTESSIQNNDDTDSFYQFNLPKSSHSNTKKHFRFSNIKPIKILFPSLTTIKEYNKRKSDELPRKFSCKTTISNSHSVSNNMKYSDRQPSITPVNSNPLSRLSSGSDECPTKALTDSTDQQIPISIDQIIIQTSTNHSLPSPTYSENPGIISPNSHLDIPLTPLNESKKMNILTFVDYIINPSLSSSLQKELKAARQLGMLVGVFTLTWLPYFILFLVVAWCPYCVSDTVYTASIWLGYLNSTLNPLIYPLCNIHFRRAFKKIFYCQHAKTKLPNLNALRELHALSSISRRR